MRPDTSCILDFDYVSFVVCFFIIWILGLLWVTQMDLGLFPNQVYLEGFLLNVLKARQMNTPTPVPPVSVDWFPRMPDSCFTTLFYHPVLFYHSVLFYHPVLFHHPVLFCHPVLFYHPVMFHHPVFIYHPVLFYHPALIYHPVQISTLFRYQVSGI